MAAFSRVEIINTVYERGLVLSLGHSYFETAKSIVRACADGGAPVVELRHHDVSTPLVLRDLLQSVKRDNPGIMLGMGSVPDSRTAALYLESEADFVSSPVFNADLARLCNRHKVTYIPTCETASEISKAEEFGVEIVRILPGQQAQTPSSMKIVMEKAPWRSLMPELSQEPSFETIREWIQAGATCLAMDVSLICKDIVGMEDWTRLTVKVDECLWLINKARGKPLFTGIEHVGLYPMNAEEVAHWYADVFDLKLQEGDTYIFASSSGPGRIEFTKQRADERAHVAIKVSNFEAACKLMRSRGLELEEPITLGTTKSVYFKQRDPAGYRVHLLYRI